MIYSEEKYESKRDTGAVMKYVKYVPEHRNSGKLPLFIYIHGAGGRGNDLSLVKAIGAMAEFDRGREVDAICIAPQCYAHTWFDIYEFLLEFLESMRNSEEVDQSRVYITGSSMGGYTTWQILQSHPEWFAAAIPVCGGGMYWNAPRLVKIPIWATHGALDTVVYPEETIKMVRAINGCGGNAKITIYPKCDHGAWHLTFASDEVWDWLFSQKRETTVS